MVIADSHCGCGGPAHAVRTVCARAAVGSFEPELHGLRAPRAVGEPQDMDTALPRGEADVATTGGGNGVAGGREECGRRAGGQAGDGDSETVDAQPDAVERQLDEIHRQVELSVEAGLVTSNDLLRVELRQQEVASNRLKVENGLKVSKLLLAQHIGADWKGFDIAQLSFDDPETPDRYYIPVEEALDHRAEYQLAEKNVEAQLYQKRMERGKLLPTVGVGAGYLYYNVTDKDVDDGMVFLLLTAHQISVSSEDHG